MREMFDLFVPINVAVKIERRISNAMGGDTSRDKTPMRKCHCRKREYKK